jgi:two-component system sensor histidine kinase DesK
VSRRTAICLLVWVLLSAVLVLVSVAALGWSGLGAAVLLLALAADLCAISPMLTHRQMSVGVLACSAVLVAVVTGVYGRSTAYAPGLVVSLLLALVAVIVSFWLSGWMLRVVWELDEARSTATQLAIAEERLRIARDLHDVFGRTLATVAVKSELAAELIRRGRTDEATSEISAVRSIADEAGREVRQVVRGYREAGLATELEGARSLLDSAGIRCVVRGAPPPDLDPGAASALAWTLREAVTNLIRHSRATECFISITDGDAVRLIVTNNGVTDQAGPAGWSGGQGLAGMSERLSAVGGRVEHQRTSDRFTLEASVPAAVRTSA